MSEHEPEWQMAEYWKAVAFELADWHAATCQHEGSLKSVPRSRKLRYADICRQAAVMLEGRAMPNKMHGDVIKRCRDAVSQVVRD